ncbi:30S ribosomal protein THX [Sinomicrobium weinanense]|uniref:30S ribosomal protein THX n=1 Tax=Sinomicrobium weinanense TaxID=2842200 RepID=A0A926JSS1_9FLAO|nr:30S ribosomal protein THX [Sinomicrobium weinanense]MBC9796521.1 30S ribosomal protein THX [Sinomicrobium weinanense]MBU3123537.1 30S ribosomal protein THX [Sinomicrobium weinanense]
MGKGDKKTKRGKIIMGSYGKLRPKRRKFRVRPKHVKGETANTADK